MKKVLLNLFLILSNITFGQQVTYNFEVDSSQTEILEVMKLFENYLSSNPEKKLKNPYWNSLEQESHTNFDFLESEFQPSLYMGFPVQVLSIKSDQNTYDIKAQFAYCKEDGSPYVLAVVNYKAKKENGKFRLYNWLTEQKQAWNCTTVGLVDFYFPAYHEFNYEKAIQLNEFILEICKNLGVSPKAFEYYLADDFDEIQELKGIDYYLGMGGENTPRGKASDDKVYCGGLGEYYPHEVFHVQVDEHFPEKHFWVSEGLATFLGGSRGESLEWHIQRANNYLKAHPEINLNELLELRNMDDKTAYHYVLGGLLAKRIFEKGGWRMIREFMSGGKTDEDYYQSIERFLGIKQSELNAYLRAQLELEANE